MNAAHFSLPNAPAAKLPAIPMSLKKRRRAQRALA
jgi:hypothetical protein